MLVDKEAWATISSQLDPLPVVSPWKFSPGSPRNDAGSPSNLVGWGKGVPQLLGPLSQYASCCESEFAPSCHFKQLSDISPMSSALRVHFLSHLRGTVRSRGPLLLLVWKGDCVWVVMDWSC